MKRTVDSFYSYDSFLGEASQGHAIVEHLREVNGDLHRYLALPIRRQRMIDRYSSRAWRIHRADDKFLIVCQLAENKVLPAVPPLKALKSAFNSCVKSPTSENINRRTEESRKSRSHFGTRRMTPANSWQVIYTHMKNLQVVNLAYCRNTRCPNSRDIP
jgi:hypothetical protein